MTAHIVIVDDEPVLRRTLTLILERAGYEVSALESGRAAQAHLASHPCDLLFLDLQMPDQDGLTLLQQLRRTHPQLAVLILTAHASIESSIRAVQLGARDYLLKPLDPEAIVARVAAVLAEQARSQRGRQIVAEIQRLLGELQMLEGGTTPALELLAQLTPTPTSRFLECGTLTLDLQARLALRQGQLVTLAPTAFDYLTTLARHAPAVVEYVVLVQEAQGYQSVGRAEAQAMCRWHIHSLRQALEADPTQPQYVLTARGLGYRLAG